MFIKIVLSFLLSSATLGLLIGLVDCVIGKSHWLTALRLARGAAMFFFALFSTAAILYCTLREIWK